MAVYDNVPLIELEGVLQRYASSWGTIVFVGIAIREGDKFFPAGTQIWSRDDPGEETTVYGPPAFPDDLRMYHVAKTLPDAINLIKHIFGQESIEIGGVQVDYRHCAFGRAAFLGSRDYDYLYAKELNVRVRGWPKLFLEGSIQNQQEMEKRIQGIEQELGRINYKLHTLRDASNRLLDFPFSPAYYMGGISGVLRIPVRVNAKLDGQTLGYNLELHKALKQLPKDLRYVARSDKGDRDEALPVPEGEEEAEYVRYSSAVTVQPEDRVVEVTVALDGRRIDSARIPEEKAGAVHDEQPLAAANYDVFLSHSSLDDALSADVKRLLEANGIRTFATPGSVPTGSWEPQIEQALRTSSTIWVLLTPHALRESVWAHHEFGYFYGYNHGIGRDPQGNSCRFLYDRGTDLRGLYAWIQGIQVESFEDPLAVAKVIANGLAKSFQVPPGWKQHAYPHQFAAPVRHPAMGPVSFSSSGLTHGPGTAQVTIGIREIGETIYYVAGLTAHPKVELAAVSPTDVVGPSHSGSVVLRLRHRDQPLHALPEDMTDVRGRKFSVLAGPRAPQGKTPLLITFETEDRRALAAVFYYTINDHPKGFPELSLHAPVPMDWRQGVMPPT